MNHDPTTSDPMRDWVEIAPGLMEKCSDAEYEARATDAMRYRWLRKYLTIANNGPGGWTCWLALDCIPYRFDPSETDPTKLLDALMKRFPT